MTSVGTCQHCARLVALDQQGHTCRHDTVGVVIRARTGKRRRPCEGSGQPPREGATR